MRYGYFDDKAREYVIERPDTPRAWTNYIGSRHYGGVITNQAGGYSFTRSPAEGRILRFRYNSVPADLPGRTIYLRESDDFWSAAWQPVGKPLDCYKTTCHFGTGYARFVTEYRGIKSTSTYFVPLGQDFEYWWITLENTSDTPRELDVFGFAEFTAEWNLINDLLNLQYSQYIAEATCSEGIISVSSCGRLPEDSSNFANRDQSRWWWMALAGAEPVSYDCDREAFLGPYRSFDKPLAVESGKCSNTPCYADNPCGALHTHIALEPGAQRDVFFMLGIGRGSDRGHAVRKEYGNAKRAHEELAKVRAHWGRQLDVFQVETPDADFNHSTNVWGHYNALMTMEWSRCCSLIYTGDQRDGLGFRDALQDTLGVTATLPDQVRQRLVLMLSGQESHGGARPEIRPWDHRPGHMPPTPPSRLRSDDCLWFFNSIPAYVAETGDVEFYRTVVPYSDVGQATVLGHMRRALEFNLTRTGANGLPCGLEADWNDCLKLGYHGESIFVTFQLRLGLQTYLEIASLLGEQAEATWAAKELNQIDEKIQKYTWDGEWFRWAIAEDGTVFGTKNYPEGQVYLNTQAWAVLSGAATQHQTQLCLDTVRSRLATRYGVMICDPAFINTPVAVMRAVLMQPGCKENGGIFSHTQSWAVLAECARGAGDTAYTYYRSFLPSAMNDQADIREVEPYVHCQSTHSQASKKEGTSRIPWLSGTASWANYTAQVAILGIQPQIHGLRIHPCIPSSWPEFRVRRLFRGRQLHIHVTNPQHVCTGVRSLRVDGAQMEGDFIPIELLKDGSHIEAEMGTAQ